MRRLLFVLIGVAALWGGAFLAPPAASGEEWSLETKRLESTSRYMASDYQFRATYGQSVHAQFQDPSVRGKVRVEIDGAEDPQLAFKRIVKKEPAKYECQYPFRGVVKFGNQQFAFAFDAVGVKPDKAKADKAKADKAKADKAKAEETKAAVKAKASKGKEKSKPKSGLLESSSFAAARGKAIRYNRFYFDRNHNGDLTDDPVTASDSRSEMMLSSGNYARVQFPVVTVPLEIDGSKYEYAFMVNVTYQAMNDLMTYAWGRFNAATYREGEITLEGKKRRLALIDFNSNGRFDDAISVQDKPRGGDGDVYPAYGDMFLLDPQASSSLLANPYDVTTSETRYHVSKLAAIDGKLYDLTISPAGDKLSLKPAKPPLGYVTNSNERFTALLYGDQGFLKISGGKSKPVPLPAGSWKLLNYTINEAVVEDEKKPAAGKKGPAGGKDDKPVQQQRKSLDLFAAVARAFVGGASTMAPAAPLRPTLVSARATHDYKTVEVRKGQSVALPFGPPYKPVVRIAFSSGADAVRLEMTLVGSAGERCSNMMVRGNRPAKPEFVIRDPKGEIVYRGNFEYG